MFARIENGQVIDRRDMPPVDDDGNVIGDWRPMVVERPDVDRTTHDEAVTLTVEPGRVLCVYRTVERGLDTIKAEARRLVDGEFSAQTESTVGIDQARRMKLDEALEVIALESDRVEYKIDDFPMLKASLNPGEAPISGARRIRDAFRASRADLARKEAIRLKIKTAIDKAGSAAEVARVRASLDWTAAS